MHVLKFGGTSVGNATGMSCMDDSEKESNQNQVVTDI